MATNDPLIGQTIGQYRIECHLAQGGMADVYLAEDTALQRQVVIKLILPHLASDKTFVARFQREGQTTANLNHLNIIQIYTTGKLPDGRPYLAMQYIGGGSLAEKLTALNQQEKLYETTAALDMVRQIANALQAAHQAGIVHRDLKPSNILLGKAGKPIVTDLGIARYEDGTRLTHTGGILGTPHYMSPEQAKGDKVDGRSDIYSLGIILYELLTGTRPFTGNSPLVVLHQHIYEPPPVLASLRPDLHPAIHAIVNTALQKEPAARYQSAAAMEAAINHALVPTTTKRPPITPVHVKAAQPNEKSDTPVWLWALPLVLLLAMGLFWMSQRDLKITGNSSQTAILAATETSLAAKLMETMAATETAVSPPTTIPTETAIPAATFAPTATLQPTFPSVSGSPQIVFQSNRNGDHEIYIMDADGTNQRALTNNSTPDRNPQVSPDSRKILFQSERDGNIEIYVMDVDGRNQQRLTHAPGKDQLPTWSPDGRQIVFISDRNGGLNVYVMTNEGNDVRQLTFNRVWSSGPTWSINDQIAFSSGTLVGNTWEIYVIDVDGNNLHQLTDNIVTDWSPDWSPDGRSILYLHSISKTDEAAIFIMNADGTNQRQLFNTDDYEWGASWTPDGDRILFTREQGAYSYIYSMNATGNDVTFISEHGGYPAWVR